MNKEFLIKMAKAKQLEYEAFKEILPENIVDRIEKVERELFHIAKEYFTQTQEGPADKEAYTSKTGTDSGVNSGMQTERNSGLDSEIKSEISPGMNTSRYSGKKTRTRTRKVTIE